MAGCSALATGTEVVLLESWEEGSAWARKEWMEVATGTCSPVLVSLFSVK